MSNIEILGARQSTYVRVVWMTCEETGAPYTITPAMPHSPEIRALHPFGRIPVMRHEGLILFESKAIATYIDRRFNGPLLIPNDPAAAAEVEAWISVVNTTIEPTWTQYFRENVFPTGPRNTRDEPAVAAVLPAITNQVDVLNQRLTGRTWLAGEAFSLADIAVHPILYYLQRFPEGAKIMRKAMSLNAYFERIATRSSSIASVPPPKENELGPIDNRR